MQFAFRNSASSWRGKAINHQWIKLKLRNLKSRNHQIQYYHRTRSATVGVRNLSYVSEHFKFYFENLNHFKREIPATDEVNDCLWFSISTFRSFVNKWRWWEMRECRKKKRKQKKVFENRRPISCTVPNWLRRHKRIYVIVILMSNLLELMDQRISKKRKEVTSHFCTHNLFGVLACACSTDQSINGIH